MVQIVNSGIIARLRPLDLAKDYNAERLEKHYRNDTEVPFTYLEDIQFPTIAKFSEHNVGLPGVEISVRPVRQYIYGALAAHLLGYVGAPNDIDRLPDVDKYNFYQPDVEGKSQVELYLDKAIRGTPGMRVMTRNVKGIIEGEVRRDAPKQGNNVLLTIDARIQFIAERALRAGGIGRGAAVVVNPQNGDILAMASVPSYDPNTFIPSVSADDWKKLTDDDTDPLTNRAIQSYAPGSTFKIVTGLAGLRKGLASRNTFTCSGGMTYGAKYMKCWVVDKHMAPHGPLSLSEAIKVSCNAFFYQWGNAAGIDQIDAVGDALGLGQKTHVPLSGESPGVLPGPDWLARVSPTERWSQGYTANVSIGQGSCEATPLQMAMVTATVANRGVSYQPRLVHRVLDQNGQDARDETGNIIAPHAPKVRADLHSAGVTNDQIELVRRGMWKVVNEPGGTGKRAQVKGVEVAGKTGTAQFWREVNGRKEKDNHTWFICFAPYNNPKFAICTMVEGGKSGGGTSAPIAQRILEESFALENGYDPGIVKQEPAQGHFKMIEEVDLQEHRESARGERGRGNRRSHGASAGEDQGEAGARRARYPRRGRRPRPRGRPARRARATPGQTQLLRALLRPAQGPAACAAAAALPAAWTGREVRTTWPGHAHGAQASCLWVGTDRQASCLSGPLLRCASAPRTIRLNGLRPRLLPSKNTPFVSNRTFSISPSLACVSTPAPTQSPAFPAFLHSPNLNAARFSGRPIPQVFSKLYPKLLSMTERVKRLIGLAPRQTGNKLIINSEKLERRVALSRTACSRNTPSSARPTATSSAASTRAASRTSSTASRRCSWTSASRRTPSCISGTPCPPRSIAASSRSSAPATARNEKRITAKDIPSIYPVGSEVLVQVTKGPIGTKGPRITTNISPRRPLPRAHAVQRPERHLAQDRIAEGARAPAQNPARTRHPRGHGRHHPHRRRRPARALFRARPRPARRAMARRSKKR